MLQNVEVADLLSSCESAFIVELAERRLDDFGDELVAQALLVLRVLEEGTDQVLTRSGACLGAGKEEGQALVNDATVVVFEVRFGQQSC